MSKATEHYQKVLIEELANLRAGETELVEVLPMMWDVVHQPELAMLLRTFLQESHLHATLLVKMQADLGAVPASKRWESLSGAIE
jgi:hypothetical protein